MRLINRAAFVVRPKEPYIQWASSTDDEAESTANSMRDYVAIYLVPEDPTGREETPPLQDFYEEIFIRELEAWYLDEEAWPQDRTLEMFQDWFEVIGLSVVEDLADGPIVIEEL